MRLATPTEKAVQTAICDHWRLLGLPGTLVAALPNAGAMGQPGLTKGLPDLLVLSGLIPGGCPVGFIELKRTPNSPVTEEQVRFAKLCERLRAPWELCVGRDDPIRVLEAWGVVRRQAA